jgi:hypothetical protein
MAKGNKDPNYVRVRDYINDYGGRKYGITEDAIGWAPDPGAGDSDTDVLLGGTKLIDAPYIDDNNRTWSDENTLRAAIDDYASRQGLKDMTVGYQAPATYVDKTPGYQAPAAPAPYVSPYKDKIDALLNQVMNPADFSYNPDQDPSWQAYAKTYGNLGNRAMTDTMGNRSRYDWRQIKLLGNDSRIPGSGKLQ